MTSLKDDQALEEPLSSLEPLPDQNIYDAVSSLGGGVMTLVYEIDLMLVEARRLLLLAQPSVEGRIDLRWWKSRKGDGREPYVFEWTRYSNGRWYAKPLTGAGLSRHVKWAGPFGFGVDEARAALTQIEKLMLVRRDLLATVGKARQSLGNKMNGAKILLSKSGQLFSEKEALAKAAKDARSEKYLEKLS